MTKDILKIKNITVNKKQKNILNLNGEINISVNDKVAILGENGAGKTTLIHVILGEESFIGKVIKNFQMGDCGVVFQNNSYNDLMRVHELLTLVLPYKKLKGWSTDHP